MGTDRISGVSTTNHVAALDADRAAGASGTGQSLLPDPSSADIGLVIARMVVENAFTQRKEARAEQQHSLVAMASAQKAQIASLREEANLRYEAACTDAVGKIFEGVAAMGGGLVAGVADDDCGRSWGQVIEAGGKVTGGVAGLISAGRKSHADDDNIAAKACENQAAIDKRSADAEDDEIREVRDHITKALDFLREFESTRHQSLMAALKG